MIIEEFCLPFHQVAPAHKLGHAGGCGKAVDARGAHLLDLAVLHYRYLLGDGQGFFLVMDNIDGCNLCFLRDIFYFFVHFHP